MGCVLATEHPTRVISPEKSPNALSPKFTSFVSNPSHFTDSQDHSYMTTSNFHNDYKKVRSSTKKCVSSQITQQSTISPTPNSLNPFLPANLSAEKPLSMRKKIDPFHTIFSPRDHIRKPSSIIFNEYDYKKSSSDIQKPLLNIYNVQKLLPKNIDNNKDKPNKLDLNKPLTSYVDDKKEQKTNETEDTKDAENSKAVLKSPLCSDTVELVKKVNNEHQPFPSSLFRRRRESKTLTPVVNETNEKIESSQGRDERKSDILEEKKIKQIREELKAQIEKRFMLNLVELVRPGKNSANIIKTLSSGKIETMKLTTPNMLSSNSREQNETSKSTEIRISSNPTETKEKLSKIYDLDRSFNEKVEEEYNDDNKDKIITKNIPHTPVRKSIFSTFLDDVNDKTPENVMTGRENLTFRSFVLSKVFDPSKRKEETKKSIQSSEGMNNSKLEELISPKSTVVETRTLGRSVTIDGQKQINQYILDKELGRGNFGKVKLGIHFDENTQFALKIASKEKLKKKLISKNKSVYSQLEGEVAIMKKLCHPNIVRLFEVIDDPNADKIYLVMEFVQRGAVMSKQYWKTEKTKTITNAEEHTNEDSIEEEDSEFHGRTLSEQKARKYFRDLILGLDFMHNFANVIHRDIKPENLLIDENDRLKISDFNISCILESTNSQNVSKNGAGTKTYLAPEAWQIGQVRGQPLDIWAAGATLYCFLYGKPPFVSRKSNELKEQILNNEPEFPDEIPISNGAQELIKKCLIKDPNQRATLQEILTDNWFTEGGRISLSNNGMSSVAVGPKDLENALTVRLKLTFVLALGIKRCITSARRSIEKRKTLETNQSINSQSTLEKLR